MATASPEPIASTAPVTVVTQTRVAAGHDAEFSRWQEEVNGVLAGIPGYLDHSVMPPNPPAQVDWVTMLRFDSDAHLDAWLNSEQRQRLLKETPDFSPEFHVRKVRTGFDSWFTAGTRPGAEPPSAWKQSMVVLLVLYPTVFLFGFFVGTPFLMNQGVPFWLTLFLSNAASTVLLGYWFTPQVSRALMWWLSPKPTAPPWTNWAGAGLVALLYCLCLAIFSQFP